jgi:hypothetical protein
MGSGPSVAVNVFAQSLNQSRSLVKLSCKALVKLSCRALVKLSCKALVKFSCKALVKLSCKALVKLSCKTMVQLSRKALVKRSRRALFRSDAAVMEMVYCTRFSVAKLLDQWVRDADTPRQWPHARTREGRRDTLSWCRDAAAMASCMHAGRTERYTLLVQRRRGNGLMHALGKDGEIHSPGAETPRRWPGGTPSPSSSVGA